MDVKELYITVTNTKINKNSMRADCLLSQCIWTLESILIDYLNGELQDNATFHDLLVYQINIIDMILNKDEFTQYHSEPTYRILDDIKNFISGYYKSYPDKSEKLVSLITKVKKEFKLRLGPDLYRVESYLKES